MFIIRRRLHFYAMLLITPRRGGVELCSDEQQLLHLRWVQYDLKVEKTWRNKKRIIFFHKPLFVYDLREKPIKGYEINGCNKENLMKREGKKRTIFFEIWGFEWTQKFWCGKGTKRGSEFENGNKILLRLKKLPTFVDIFGFFIPKLTQYYWVHESFHFQIKENNHNSCASCSIAFVYVIWFRFIYDYSLK
jgi:hypothetical protein